MATQQITRAANPITEIPICIHALAGRAPRAKMCGYNHECGTCQFDQMLEDMAPVVPARKVRIATAKAA